MYETILVPIDGSDASVVAAEEALSIARQFDADLSLLSVIESPEPPLSAEDTPEGRAALDEQADATIERVQERAADAGVPHGTTIERGRPRDVISAHVTENDVDLVAMGTHGRTGIERVLLGSVAEHVVRTSPVPVLTAHARDAVGRFDRILVPTDGSRCAERAADHAIAIAEQYGATIHALSVVDVQAMASGLDVGAQLPEIVDVLTDQREDAVASVRERASERGVDCETTVVEGAPTATITAYAAENDVDLVTMGTHGTSGLERLMLGSVAERTIRTSDLPVMAVPSDSR